MPCDQGELLDRGEAVRRFRCLPTAFQLASLHPYLLEVDAERDKSLQPTYWSYEADGSLLLHCFQLGTGLDLSVTDVQSAYGYGGPISNCELQEFLGRAEDAFCRWALAHKVMAEFLRFHPLVPQPRWYGGAVTANRDTVFIDLRRDLVEQYEARRRTDVRRFMTSGLGIAKVSDEEMLQTFPTLYAENMEAVQASSYYRFSRRYFELLLGFEEADSWIAKLGNVPLAAAIVLASPRARIAEYHLAAKVNGHETLKPMVGLLHTMASYYQEARFERFYLGGGRTTAPDDSLLFFKKGFSKSTLPYFTGSRVFDSKAYGAMKLLMPQRALSGRVLFYKD